MSVVDTLISTYELAIGRATTGEQVHQALADHAEARVAELIASGSASPVYRRFVNGIEDAPNTSLIIGSGSINYQFSNMAEAVAFALQFAIDHSPRRSGAYIDNWFLLVNTVPFASADLLSIPPGAEVALTNSSDYHRKIDVGGMRMSVAPQIIEQTRQAVLRKFKSITAERLFITFPGAYVLKGRAIRSGLSFNKKSRAKNIRDRFIQVRPPSLTRRKDARAGEMMTYPALVMNELR